MADSHPFCFKPLWLMAGGGLVYELVSLPPMIAPGTLKRLVNAMKIYASPNSPCTGPRKRQAQPLCLSPRVAR